MNQPNYFDFPNSDTAIPLVKRPGLQVKKIYYQSEPHWVAKLPHDQEFHHLNEQEFTILNALDGNVSYRELEEQFNLKHSPFRVNFREITQLLTEFFKKSLVEPTRGGTGLGMHLYSREKRREKLKKKFKSIFAIQWKGWDPDWFLNLTNPYVTWFFSRPVVMLNMALLFLTLCWMGIHYEEFFSRLPPLWNFLDPENWVSLGLAAAGAKFFHELGHAYAEKRFGGECHEIGVMIFFFMPTLYCNTSDSWLLPNKWQRIWIGMGGVYVELFIFSIVAILWWFSSSGDVQEFCMNIMFVTSLSAVLTNGNPLLRYDGYFVLADWLEIPNLSQKANQEFNRVFLLHGCGDHRKTDLWTSRYNKMIYFSYAVAAFVFRVLLMVGISTFLIGFFQSAGLANLGVAIAIVSLVTVFATPLKSLFKHLREPGNWQQMKRRNLIITGMTGLLLGGLLIVPFPYWIPAECAVLIRKEANVHAFESGRIAEIYVEPGETVIEGQPILRLANESLEKKAIEIEMEFKSNRRAIEMKYRFPNGNASNRNDSDTDSDLLVLESKERMLQKKLSMIQGQVRNLLVKAPCDGVVYGVAADSAKAQTRETALSSRSGNPLEPTGLNSQVEKDTELCIVAPKRELEISLTYEQDYGSLVKVGQKTKMLISSHPERLHGEIREVSLNESLVDEIPKQIAKGSSAAAVAHAKQLANPETKKSVTYKDGQVLSSTLLQATSSHDADVTLVYGSTGQAFIEVGYRSLAQRIWRVTCSVFQKNL